MKKQYTIQDHGFNKLRKKGNFDFGFYGYGLGDVLVFDSKEDAEDMLAKFLGGYYNEKRQNYYIG